MSGEAVSISLGSGETDSSNTNRPAGQCVGRARPCLRLLGLRVPEPPKVGAPCGRRLHRLTRFARWRSGPGLHPVRCAAQAKRAPRARAAASSAPRRRIGADHASPAWRASLPASAAPHLPGAADEQPPGFTPPRPSPIRSPLHFSPLWNPPFPPMALPSPRQAVSDTPLIKDHTKGGQPQGGRGRLHFMIHRRRPFGVGRVGRWRSRRTAGGRSPRLVARSDPAAAPRDALPLPVPPLHARRTTACGARLRVPLLGHSNAPTLGARAQTEMGAGRLRLNRPRRFSQARPRRQPVCHTHHRPDAPAQQPYFSLK